MSSRKRVGIVGARGHTGAELIRLVAARHNGVVDVVSSGGWTPGVLAHVPQVGHLQLVTSRKTPYLLCPSQWELVRWLKQRGRGPVYLCDPDPEMRRLIERGGVHPDDLIERTPEELATPMLWPDRWLVFGVRDPAQRYATREVDPAPFRLPRLVVPQAHRTALAAWRRENDLEGTLVLFQPGNKRTHKRGKRMTADHPKHWPAEHWAAVAANGTIIGNRLGLDRRSGRKPLQQVGTADDAHQLAITHYRHPLDMLFFQHPGNAMQRLVFGDGNGIRRHDLTRLARMTLDVLAGVVGAGKDRSQPPGLAPLGTVLDSPHQVAFADNSQHASVGVDNRQRTDIMLKQQAGDFPHFRVKRHGNDIGSHNIHSTHKSPPGRVWGVSWPPA